MATTAITVICRCTSPVASTCALPSAPRRRERRGSGGTDSQIRQRWPEILVRGDSGFCREPIMTCSIMCRLGAQRPSAEAHRQGAAQVAATLRGERSASRRFREFRDRTLDSWSRSRRVVAKAEWLPGAGGGNPRFVVTSLDRQTIAKQALYELYWPVVTWRTESRSSNCGWPTALRRRRANQLRVILMTRRAGLQGTELRTLRHHPRAADQARGAYQGVGAPGTDPRRYIRCKSCSHRRSRPWFALPRCASHLDSARRSEHETHRRRPDQGEVRPNAQLSARVTHHYGAVSRVWHENHGAASRSSCSQTPAPSTRDQNQASRSPW